MQRTWPGRALDLGISHPGAGALAAHLPMDMHNAMPQPSEPLQVLSALNSSGQEAGLDTKTGRRRKVERPTQTPAGDKL